MNCYLVHAIGTNRYKIGKTGGEPQRRLDSFQVGSPHLLEVIAAMDWPDEAWWHWLFDPWRLHGEWFELESSHVLLFQEIASAKDIHRGSDGGIFLGDFCWKVALAFRDFVLNEWPDYDPARGLQPEQLDKLEPDE